MREAVALQTTPKYDFDGATKRCNTFCLICLTPSRHGQQAVLCCLSPDEATLDRCETACELCWSLTPCGVLPRNFPLGSCFDSSRNTLTAEYGVH